MTSASSPLSGPRFTQEFRPDGGDDAVLDQHVGNSRIVVAVLEPQQRAPRISMRLHIHSVAALLEVTPRLDALSIRPLRLQHYAYHNDSSQRSRPARMNLESQRPAQPRTGRLGAISDILADAGADLVASLPDGWIAPLIKHLAQGQAVPPHVPVNREESAVGLCSGAFFGGRVGVALMGASGFLTCIYAITKINYTYQIPLLFLITLRGAPGDTARYHVSNGLYLRSVIEAIDIPALYLERFDELPKIADAYRHASVLVAAVRRRAWARSPEGRAVMAMPIEACFAVTRE